MPGAFYDKPRSVYSIKLQKSLYGLRQYGRMLYNRLNEYLLEKGLRIMRFTHVFLLRKSHLDLLLLQYILMI
jgi:hypothetical protein